MKHAGKQQRTYADEFKDRLTKLERDAQSAGTNLTEVCRVAGVSRATPDRWRKRVPKTIELVTLMEAIVAEKAREQRAALDRMNGANDK